MRQRIALGGISMTTAVVAVLLLAWAFGLQEPASAMEQMAESIRRAKSYSVKMITEMKLAREPGKPPATAKMTGTLCWLAPGSVRMESRGGEFTVGQDRTQIFPAGKKGISIDHKTKTFRRVPARRGHVSPLMLFEALSRYSGQADHELGRKQINGKEARGFVIEAKRIDPDSYAGPVEIWIDAASHLPVELRYEMKGATAPGTVRMTDFQWNVDLDPKLFDPTPPDGYTDTTPEPPSVDEQIDKIREALKLYAELSGGHYPRVKMIYGDVTRDEMLKMAGFTGQLTRQQLRDERYKRVLLATWGLATINGILRDNPDAAYHGLEVGPKDKDEVLLRWKLDDGHYQVMYGDLRSEAVSGERLRTLERR